LAVIDLKKAHSRQSSTFSGKYSSLEEISNFVQQAAKQAGLSDFAVYSVETAVDEACSNIIEHAYGGEGKGDIECTCEVTGNELTITLQDHGAPFDPDRVPAPDLTCPLQDRSDHGFGLYFIKKWMDEVHFAFDPQSGNTLKMVKYLEQKPDDDPRSGT
jgi:serine/threonine-protein kinase RsbW